MDVVIVGAGGHGRVVLEILRLAGKVNPVGFIDADAARAGTTLAGLPVLGPINLLPRLRRQSVTGATIAIGDNRARLGYAEMVTQAGLELVSAIHPSANISPDAKLGRNLVIAAGAIIGVDSQLADSALVNTGAVVDHECQIGRGVHICPGALLAGRVQVDEGAFVGLGARILPCLKIGAFATVGAGAVVLDDVPPAATVVGVPARIIRVG